MKLQPITPRTLEHFQDWCRVFHKNTSHPVNAERRFSIGMYQISQALNWKCDGPVRWQSYAAAALHFTAAATACELSVLSYLPSDGRLEDISTYFNGWNELVRVTGEAQRQLIYKVETFPRWRERYDAKVLETTLAGSVEMCFSLVPPDAREQSVFDEMQLICGVLR
jgi:hypothetical protein